MISSVIAGLLGCVLAVGAAQAYVWLCRFRQHRYPADAPYAVFERPPAGGVHQPLQHPHPHPGAGLFHRLPCEGRCHVTRWHEDAGDGNATCMACGTPRPVCDDGA